MAQRALAIITLFYQNDYLTKGEVLGILGEAEKRRALRDTQHYSIHADYNLSQLLTPAEILHKK